MTTSGPRPAARSATLKTPSHARKKAATPRVVAEEEKAKGAAARSAATGSSAARQGKPGRRLEDTARAYSAAADTARDTMGMLSRRSSMAAASPASTAPWQQL